MQLRTTTKASFTIYGISYYFDNHTASTCIKKSKTAEELTDNSNPFISEDHTGNVADAHPTKTTIIKPTEATEPST